MIVKNEEDTIGRCLDSIKDIADEIIIVDTGSTDCTKEIAAAFTDKIYDFEWIDDFSAARNFAFEQATMEYILWLDADDILLPEDIVKFKALKNILPPDIDVVMLRYNTGFDGQGRAVFSYYRERLSKRSCHFKWQEPVHEYLAVSGNRLNVDICVTHRKPPGRPGGRNIRIYEARIAKGERLSPRGMYYFARELRDHGRFSEAITWFERFLASGLGWVEDVITACGELGNCYLAENKPEEALRAMLRSFAYDTPRAELCCQIGYYFKNLENYKLAVFWFELVLKLDSPKTQWGFRQEDCWGYIPCIELAVCYDKLGALETASKFNDMAAEYKPDSPAILHNKKYFENRLTKQNL